MKIVSELDDCQNNRSSIIDLNVLFLKSQIDGPNLKCRTYKNTSFQETYFS